jgi:tRNA-specific 2-thiouridylase
VKLGELASIADRLGAARIATGHYARVGASPSGAACIYAGVDRRRTRATSSTRPLTRSYAASRSRWARAPRPKCAARRSRANIPGATKGESQELCFVGQGDHAYVGLVEERADKARIRPGPIVDADGRVVGRHEGVHRYTVGQRRGLGVAVGKPAFVSRIDPSTGTVTLGDAGDLLAREVESRGTSTSPRARRFHRGRACGFATATKAPSGTCSRSARRENAAHVSCSTSP